MTSQQSRAAMIKAVIEQLTEINNEHKSTRALFVLFHNSDRTFM